MKTKVAELLTDKKKTLSLEIFPPQTAQGYDKLINTIEQFARLQPNFMSCTYGAGGGSRDKTLDIVEHIQQRHHLPGVAHLTCVLNTKDDIRRILDDLATRNIHHLLALRGDPPQDAAQWQPAQDHFRYAYELCAFIKNTTDDHFSVGVAGFPEGHIDCPDREQDAHYLKRKIDAGADYVVTQLFFNNQDYFDYVERLHRLGVNVPVLPGILPITNFERAVNFCQRCGTTIPSAVKDVFAPLADDHEATLKQGIDWCVQQCRELLLRGAPGIHFYPLNKIHPLNEIVPQIKELL